MRLIVTRPEEDAARLTENLQALGHEVKCAPLIRIAPKPDVIIPVQPYQAICVTSANGLRAIDVPHHLLSLPVYAVGPQSAAQARLAGFESVHAEGGDVAGLVSVVRKRLHPSDGTILYLSGVETSGDLEGNLRANGFSVSRVMVYDAVPANPPLHELVVWADGVLLYSHRTATLWFQGLERQGLDARMLTHFCLSANVAQQIPSGFNVKISASPTEQAMLEMLANAEQQK